MSNHMCGNLFLKEIQTILHAGTSRRMQEYQMQTIRPDFGSKVIIELKNGKNVQQSAQGLLSKSIQ